MGPPIGLLGGAGPSTSNLDCCPCANACAQRDGACEQKRGFSMYHPARSILQDAGCTRAALKERERARKPTTLLAIYLPTPLVSLLGRNVQQATICCG